jgi:hypothetical protein
VLGTICIALIHFSPHADFPADTSDRASYRAVWRHIDSRRIIILHGFTILALSIGSALVPNFLKDQRGMSAELISILSAGAAVGTVSFGFFTMRHSKLRSAPLLAAAIATGLTATGYFLFAVLDLVPGVAIAYVLRGGMFSTWALFLAAMGGVALPRLRTRAFAMVEILGGSAVSFGPVIAAVLYDIDPPLFLIVSGAASFFMSGILILNYGAVARARRKLQMSVLEEEPLPPR